jgi:hypothetical protein
MLFFTPCNDRREPRFQAPCQLGLNEAGGVTQTFHGQALLLVRSHNGDIDFRVLQIARHLGPSDGDLLDARIVHLIQDGFAGHLADGLGDARQSIRFHGRYPRSFN